VNGDDPPPYWASSYTWGDPTITASISLNGKLFNVAGNLLLALRELQHPGISKAFWIDAICINQNDTAE